MFSSVILVGNCTRDPEVRYTPQGTPVATVAVAINRKYQDQEKVSYIDVTIWGKLAEIAGQYLTKGSKVLFAGRLEQDSWEDKETGQRRSKVHVVAEQMKMLGGKRREGADEDQSGPAPMSADNIPF